MLSIALSILNLFIAFVFPLGVLIYLALRRQALLKPFLLGAATFFVFQCLLRLPLLQLVLAKQMWFAVWARQYPVLSFILIAFSAGLFEEGGRYIMMSLFMKKNTRWADGLTFGLGHGGIEAVLFVGFGTLQSLIYSSTYLSVTPPLNILGAGVERIAAMVIQVFLSMLVLKAVRLKKPIFLLLALLAHGVIDSSIVFYSYFKMPLMMFESMMVLVAALCLWGIAIFKKSERTEFT